VVPAAALTCGLVISLVISGCSSSSQSGSSTPSTTAAPPALKVTVAGRDQNVKGPVKCDITNDGFVKIAIGEGIAGTDITPYSATMTNADPPDVRSVDLGEVNGEGLVYLKGFDNDTASATHTGKSYKITGTAKSKPFEMDVTCP